MGVLSDLFGKKPKIPTLPSISAAGVQRQTIADNLAAMPEATQLAGAATEANIAQIQRALEAAVPGAFSNIQRNIVSQTRGEIPADVSAAIQRDAAATGLDLGVMGAPGTLGGNIAPRNLGLTSLQLMQQGQQNYQALAQPFLNAPVSAQSMWFSPQQRLEFASSERNNMFQRDLLAAQVKAAPDPVWRGVHDTIMTMLGFVAGGLGGGGGGYQGTAPPPSSTVPATTGNMGGGFGFGSTSGGFGSQGGFGGSYGNFR